MCNEKIVSAIIFAVGVVLFILGFVLGFGVIPGIIDDQVTENVQLVEGSEAYERWVVTPMALKFKVYIFTVKNPDDIMNGDKPIVEEVGPYVFNMYRKKLNITYDETEDTYEYWQNSFFVFDEAASAPYTLEDEIQVLNVAQQGVFQKGENMFSALAGYINKYWRDVFPDNGDSLFHKITVREYLFDGYKFCQDPKMHFLAQQVCKNIKEEGVETIHEDPNSEATTGLLFAFFKHKQNMRDGPYVVKAGIHDAKQVGEIIRWKDQTNLTYWNHDNDDVCNIVRGRDSSIYPPLNDKDTTFDIFNTDICRIVTLKHDGEATYKGVDGFVSTLGVENLSNDGDKQCYCKMETKDLNGEKKCLPNGFGDLAPCTGANVVMSFPHFLYADEAYANTVEGVNPVPELHKTFVNMEPKTGTPLEGAKRIQFNMILRPVEYMDITQTLTPSVLPLIWVEEGVALPDSLIDQLNDQYFSKLVVVDAVVYTLIAVGAVLALISGGFFLMKCKSK